ncbi:glutamic acid-rich protein [Ricinus communis]|uniref:DNA binding protein, putative n=1 Tax=Ricinus communis TaxID=3988 RepID=B9RI61_RICCO|nr:glutamic acid-rich protein [Ricinus communis]EEF48833.1 DNA binding protein, putative [Ricinus communis]|eukprot:XP_002513430.1 glutamic acid-rich protein [Ricinus communis]
MRRDEKRFHMARQHHHQETSVQPWGTLEELLLACAVNRHGTKSWDSIAMEVQNRTSTLPSLTSQNCKDKYNDLKRRFMSQNDTSSIIDQLRKIRVEELRREVQRRDVSIVSLELKVKRLEEERERSFKEEADLISERKFSIAGNSTAGGDDSVDERDSRSFNESNSTGQQKAETTMVRQQNDDVDRQQKIKVKPNDSENKNEQDPVPSGSDPGGSHKNGNDKKPLAMVKKESEIKTSQTTGGFGGESNEVGESVGESKREERDKEKEKQNNSDVQSSISLSQNKKKRRGSSGGGDRVGSSSGEEPEGGDEVSPAVKSEPLVKLLGIIRSHRLGSTFERRLRSQESERYKNLIRQHIDLQTIQSRLDKGVYSSCIQKFFRDLLLLFNNAIIFFRKNSPENLAACELRAVVQKEMTEKLRKLKTEPVTAKPEPKQTAVSFSKPNKSSSTIVVCGKGNSKKAIPENDIKKGDKKEREVEEKIKLNERQIDSFVKIEEKSIRKKRTKDRSISNHRSSNTSNKNGEVKHQYGGNELSSHDALEMKVERKGKGSTARKKQGAASFLKRMKQNSPSEVPENDDEDYDDDNDNDSSEEDEKKDSKGKEEKGRRRGKIIDGMTERVTRSSRGRGARENGRGKRGVGRPPRKQAERGESGGGTGKRGRENGGSEVGRTRKRSKR